MAFAISIRVCAMALLLVSLSFRTAQGFSVRRSFHRNTLLSLAATRAPSQQATSTAEFPLTCDAPIVTLKRSRQSKAFRNGNQLVFQRAVQKGIAPRSALVQVVVAAPDKSEQLPLAIGWGVFNPDSLYKVRILCHRYLQASLYKRISEPETTVEEAMSAILHHHLKMALRKRQALNLPCADENTMYRLVNGEGDSLSGLQVDVIGETHIVVQSSAGWCETHKDLILEAVEEVMPGYDTVWKVAEARLKQDGYKTQSQKGGKKEEAEEEEDAQAVLCLENGVTFQTFPTLDGQKTGVYCDQRENRRTLSQYTKGKTVLDLCCFHGGFSLTSLVQGGATLAVGVDSSAAAIESAQTNAQLNSCEDKATFLQADISDYMHQAFEDGITYDVVVLDPPKLAPRAAMLDKARRKYHALNRDAIKLVNAEEGGILMTCTCSAAMTVEEGGQYFLNMVAGAAQAAGREVTLLSKAGAASCHTQSPNSWPAGAYLTAALFYVHPVE